MISLYKLAKSILLEKMSFNQLLAKSERGRKKRGSTIKRITPLTGTASQNAEFLNFSYKSPPEHNTTGLRWRGQITFENKDLLKNKDKSQEDIFCKVDCGCPDYRYRWAYANKTKDAGTIGNNSLNKCIDRFPTQTNPYLNPGLCKHLISLKDYLKTKLQESSQPTVAEKLIEIAQQNPNFTFNVEDSE